VSDSRISEYEVDGIHVIRVAEPYSNEMGFARRLLSFGRFARMATKVVANLKGDVVLATSTPLSVGIPGMKGARRLGVPFVFEVRDLWPKGAIVAGVLKNPFLIWYSRRLERTLYQAADRIIALAPGIKEGICQTGYPSDRVVIIPNSCDLDVFQPSDEPLIDERFGAPGDFRLVYTGAHGLVNGLDAVLDAAVELMRRREKGLRFIFIGQGGQRERLMERSRRNGIEGMVSWVGSMPKEELAQVLPRMDAGLMILKNLPALYYATSPNKFFDYIACGLPVLNNYPGWLADMIRENHCGLVAPPDNPSAFADAVVWMRDHREELDAMGARSRQLAESQFSRDRLGGMFVKTLEASVR
jgi:glycosyltransferase involved in cell wall biosynthesis